MKIRIILLGLLVVLVSSCMQKGVVGDKPTDEEVKKVKEIALPIVSKLQSTLKGALISAMQKGGPMAAIEVCNVKALQLTEEVAKNSNADIELKRVSRNNRNPENAPDEIDEIVLSQFDEIVAKGEKLPDFMVNKIKSIKGTDFYLYKPLMILPLCLNCHGDVQSMDGQLVEEIKKLYPEDKAVGYKKGDLRGLVRVKIKSGI